MSALVVDASAALALVLGQAGGEATREHLDDQARTSASTLVSELFWLEVVNVMAHRHRLPPATIVEAIYELDQFGFTTTAAGRPAVLAVIDAVGRWGLSAYDAHYLVLAESSDARLLTADAAMAAAAGDRAILVGADGGVAQERPRYRADPPWTTWAGAARYLEELRADYGSPSG